MLKVLITCSILLPLPKLSEGKPPSQEGNSPPLPVRVRTQTDGRSEGWVEKLKGYHPQVILPLLEKVG
jgi:hypothetical protein